MTRWRITFGYDRSTVEVEAEELVPDSTTLTWYRYDLVVDQPRRLVVRRLMRAEVAEVRQLE